MTQDLTFTDLFCGAGGSSGGAVKAGAILSMASNHWKLAIETHATNFPDARHDCADISQVDPRRYPSTDILLASPECTHHSQARTKKHVPDLFDPDGDASHERSRATMWDVPRFAEIHRYQAVVVENVVEIARWAPFDSWLSAMDSLGYDHRVLSLNSMATGAVPQSRDRCYVVFWRKGNRKPNLDFTPPSWCWSCEEVVEGRQSWKNNRSIGKYRSQYVFTCPVCHQEAAPLVRPAAAAIDWGLPCPRVGDRKKPLADATLRRIQTGLEKFGTPTVIQRFGHTFERPGYVRAWSTSQPMPTQMTDLLHGLAMPGWLVSTTHDNPPSSKAVDQPLPTQTGRLEMGIATPPGFVMVNRTHNRPRSFAEPFAPMLTADHQGIVLIPELVPFITELRGGSSDARRITEPLATVSAGGNHHAVVLPFYLKNFGDGSDPSMAHGMDEPLGTVTTQDHHSVVEPFTVTYHGKGTAHRVTQPLPTQTSVDRHAVVEPAVTVDDCGFRMLEPEEVGRAMAFADDYVVLGNKRERVRQYGNAVTPPAMTAIVQRVIEALA